MNLSEIRKHDVRDLLGNKCSNLTIGTMDAIKELPGGDWTILDTTLLKREEKGLRIPWGRRLYDDYTLYHGMESVLPFEKRLWKYYSGRNGPTDELSPEKVGQTLDRSRDRAADDFVNEFRTVFLRKNVKERQSPLNLVLVVANPVTANGVINALLSLPEMDSNIAVFLESTLAPVDGAFF